MQSTGNGSFSERHPGLCSGQFSAEDKPFIVSPPETDGALIPARSRQRLPPPGRNAQRFPQRAASAAGPSQSAEPD